MIQDHKVHRCACKVRGQSHVFTLDASGRHVLMLEPGSVHLIRDASWFVEPMQRGKPALQARASTRAPGIKKGRALHRLALKVRDKKRSVRSLNGNLLDCRHANLQTLTRSDLAILSRREPMRELVGVQYDVPPKWLRTNCYHHASVKIDGVKVHLGSFPSKEEGACAVDAALRRLYGPDATCNEKLGLIPAKAARTKLCRRAAKVARRKVREHQQKVALEKTKAIVDPATSREEKLAIFRSLRAKPHVEVMRFDAKDIRPTHAASPN
jgi:hypothetical protein